MSNKTRAYSSDQSLRGMCECDSDIYYGVSKL